MGSQLLWPARGLGMTKASGENEPAPDEPRSPAADLLHLVELDEFVQDWDKLGLNDDDDMWALQLEIMRAPERAPLVQGTGGLRKLRFAPPRWKSGKSGAARVCYVYFREHGIVLLVMAYARTGRTP